MLLIYARHIPECNHKDDPKYRRCRCPKRIDGYVDDKRVCRSAQTRSWEQAERKARLIEEAADPSKQRQPIPTAIANAIEIFLADKKGEQRIPGSSQATWGEITLGPSPPLGAAHSRGHRSVAEHGGSEPKTS